MSTALTFNDLRKIQKNESKAVELTDLDDNFILKAQEYLERKKESSESREYKSSRRIFRKIIAQREKKIVKNAQLSLRSNIKASELPLLPREQELFRETKKIFEEHRDRIKDTATGHAATNVETSLESEKPDIVSEENNSEEELEEKEDEPESESVELEEKDDQLEDGYDKVKIVTHVPEFMGTDLEAYGPYEEGDSPVLPEDNAEILINRGNAEEI